MTFHVHLDIVGRLIILFGCFEKNVSIGAQSACEFSLADRPLPNQQAGEVFSF